MRTLLIFSVCQIILSQAFAEQASPPRAEVVSGDLSAIDAKVQANVAGTPNDLLVPPGQSVPSQITKCLTRLPVTYCDQRGNCDRKGLLIVNKELAGDLTQVFNYMRTIKFPISKIVPTNQYPLYPLVDGKRAPGWSDEKIMSDDDTTSYNPRYILGKDDASLHAFGEAIDINPLCNPAIHKSGQYEPANGRRKVDGQPEPDCSLDSAKGQLLVAKFRSLGWKWGGDWSDPRDSQHFQKPGPDGKKVYKTGPHGERINASHCQN
jgi:hypothetical protein